jgi:hypothetical protein
MLSIPPTSIVLFNIVVLISLFRVILSDSRRAAPMWLCAGIFGVGVALLYSSTWLFLISLAALVFVIIAADRIAKRLIAK